MENKKLDKNMKQIDTIQNELNYVKKVANDLSVHLNSGKRRSRLWLCNVSLQHLEGRITMLHKGVSDLRLLLDDGGYLVEPYWYICETCLRYNEDECTTIKVDVETMFPRCHIPKKQ